MDIIDLRSDTVTKPSPEMRQAMYDAEVGDDVLGDDPTMNLLQETVAEMFGKESALFVASGTMANLIAMMSHTQHGEEVIVERESHTFNYEAAGPAALAGVQLHPITGENGILKASQIQGAIRPGADSHVPPTRLICLENTHNRGGGKIYPIEKIQAIHTLAERHSLKMHLDGARLFNACVATGLNPKEYANLFDSLMFCFSKGLGAPVGSILVGSKNFIQTAHRYRKMLGGGMRQVGILAAAADYSLKHNIERLADDHKHAQLLAQSLAKIDKFTIEPESVETNIVIFDVTKSGLTAENIVARLAQKGVLMLPFGKYLVRAITHLNVTEQQINAAIRILRNLYS